MVFFKQDPLKFEGGRRGKSSPVRYSSAGGCKEMLLPALSPLTEQTSAGSGKQQWLGAGQPCSGTVHLTWLWPHLLGTFCRLTLPNLA